MYLQKGFFAAVLPLMIVYFMALNIRVGEYGWTDNRYVVAAFGVWIVVCCCVYLFRQRDIRWFFGSFIIIALISVVVPGVRMFDVSIASQRERLYEFFEENDMLRDGQIVPGYDTIQAEYSIKNILGYLNNRGALDDVIETFKDPLDVSGLDRWELEDEVLRSLNIQTYSRYNEPVSETTQILEIQAGEGRAYDIAGYSQMLKLDSWNTSPKL